LSSFQHLEASQYLILEGHAAQAHLRVGLHDPEDKGTMIV